MLMRVVFHSLVKTVSGQGLAWLASRSENLCTGSSRWADVPENNVLTLHAHPADIVRTQQDRENKTLLVYRVHQLLDAMADAHCVRDEDDQPHS